jgi:hypothetical protein
MTALPSQILIKEEEHDFQRCIGSVRESLLQQVESNIKQINDHCMPSQVQRDIGTHDI